MKNIILSLLLFTAFCARAQDIVSAQAQQKESVEKTVPEAPVKKTAEKPDGKYRKNFAGKQKPAKPADTAVQTKVVKKEQRNEQTTQTRQMPAFLPEGKAPRPARKPSPSPLEDVRRLKTTKQGVAPDLNIQPQKSFQPPDWTQPMRDLTFDKMEGDLEKMDEEMVATGHVKLHLDTLDFAADKFSYSKANGEMVGEGNVVIRQDESCLEAAKVLYNLPQESELPAQSPLAPAASEQERAKLRLSMGTLEATDAHIVQPGQELYASELRYSFADSTGYLNEARGHAGMYYFQGKKFRILGPASLDGEDIWVTTCDHDPPHYKIRLKKASIREGQAIYATNARLQLGSITTPLWWPKWGYKAGQTGTPINFDFDSGHRAKLGYYVDVGQQFTINPDAQIGLRLYPTTQKGVGFGLEGQYDFTQTPSSPLFLGKGQFESLYTTENQGYLHLYHRHELFDDTQMLVQVEKWSGHDFYKDFYYDQYKNRTGPRTFASVAHTEPGYIATATVKPRINNFTVETERLPEITYHLLQRPVLDNLYVSFDTIDGYNEREPWGAHALRLANIGRLTYDLNVHEGLSLTPFTEVMATYYSKSYNDDDADVLLAETVGVTAQTRLHKIYPGILGFSNFKHVIVPSVTYFYQPEPTMGLYERPQFDALDAVHGRSRIESKMDHILYGKDAETDEVWQVARLTLYQGTDFWNEISKAKDYEAELDLRPRPWWGWMLAAERHELDKDVDITNPHWWESGAYHLRELVTGKPYDDELTQFDPLFGEYNRILTYVYYDDTANKGRWNGHLGYSYTETQDVASERELLYGAGYQLGQYWGLGFEHRYDLERDELMQQTYEIRRNLHCWEASLKFRDRQQGWDVGISFNVVAFPGAKLKF